jgi:predicted RNA binding protein YcfA (HicA-like mRNA interferase family)
MTPVSGKLFAKLFERKGWVLKRLNGSHHIFSHPAKTEIISVPVHKNEGNYSAAKLAIKERA